MALGTKLIYFYFPARLSSMSCIPFINVLLLYHTSLNIKYKTCASLLQTKLDKNLGCLICHAHGLSKNVLQFLLIGCLWENQAGRLPYPGDPDPAWSIKIQSINNRICVTQSNLQHILMDIFGMYLGWFWGLVQFGLQRPHWYFCGPIISWYCTWGICNLCHVMKSSKTCL